MPTTLITEPKKREKRAKRHYIPVKWNPFMLKMERNFKSNHLAANNCQESILAYNIIEIASLARRTNQVASGISAFQNRLSTTFTGFRKHNYCSDKKYFHFHLLQPLFGDFFRKIHLKHAKAAPKYQMLVRLWN